MTHILGAIITALFFSRVVPLDVTLEMPRAWFALCFVFRLLHQYDRNHRFVGESIPTRASAPQLVWSVTPGFGNVRSTSARLPE